MGRIADALKRAETERRRAQSHSSLEAEVGGGVAVVDAPAPPLPEHPKARAPAYVEPKSTPEPTGDEPIALAEGLSESLVSFHERTSLISEQYRSLRTRLLSQNPRYEHKMYVVTSAIPREGKSVTTLNFACTLAEVRHLRVLVVDGDFRRGTLAQMLNQTPGPGLADVLAGGATYEDALQKTRIPNLFFMPAGSTQGSSATELLTSVGVRDVFARMQNDFHYTMGGSRLAPPLPYLPMWHQS